MIIVLCVRKVPSRVKGAMSRVLVEVESGVFIGDVSKRVRESLWKTAIHGCGMEGRAWMAYPDRKHPQGMRLLTHNTRWSVVDFAGVILMQRPLTPTQ